MAGAKAPAMTPGAIRAREWYVSNKARAQDYKKRQEVKERKNAARRAQPSDHPARIAARERMKVFRNTDAGREDQRLRSAKRRASPQGKAYYRQYVGIRRASVANAAKILDADRKMKAEVDAIYREAAERGLSVDHIYPLRHKQVSGLHVPWNLRLVTFEENRRKNNKLPNEVGLNLE